MQIKVGRTAKYIVLKHSDVRMIWRRRAAFAEPNKEAPKPEAIEKQIKEMESEGTDVPPEDQSIEFLRSIQSQAAVSGVNIIGNSRQPSRTNAFFMGGGKALVNAYYRSAEKLGIQIHYNAEVNELELENGVFKAALVKHKSPQGEVLRTERITAGPKEMLGTKCPSMMSTCTMSAPAPITARTSSPSFEKSVKGFVDLAFADVPRIPLFQPYSNVAMQKNVSGYQYWFHRRLDYRALVKSNRREGTYWMPCAGGASGSA